MGVGWWTVPALAHQCTPVPGEMPGKEKALSKCSSEERCDFQFVFPALDSEAASRAREAPNLAAIPPPVLCMQEVASVSQSKQEFLN